VAAELIRDPQGETPAGLVILWPAVRGDDVAVKEAFRLIQLAGPSLRQAGGILVTASRMDGAFGFGALNGNGNPISGALAGLVKTAAREWPEVHCKAVDLNPELGISAGEAAPLVEEMFRSGPVEVGLSGKSRSGLLVQTAAPAGRNAMPTLQDGDVVIVTGGARGITATTALQLARGQRLKLVLLGRSQLTEQEPEWLAGLAGEAEIKHVLVTRANGSGSPKKIAAQLRELLAQREIRDCLQQIQATGATAVYRSVDVRNAADIGRLCAEIRQQLGPIRGLIHGAGVLADRKIEDKTAEQFDLVYSTKVSGLRNLLAALGHDDLRLLALFSSYTGRFGRVGQVDYAAANEVLNKIAQSVSRQRPKCRVVSFNWGPWNGGMVSDGLRKIFESEGVGLIEPDAGAEFFVREISSGNDGCVEVLALAQAGSPASGPARTTSFPSPALSGTLSPSDRERDGVRGCVSVANGLESAHLAFEREVSVATVPCLASHVLNGRAVLPAALMIEWLGHGAVHGNPGLAFHGFENFRVLKGLVLEPGGAAHVSVLAEAGQWRDGLLRVPVRMVSQAGSRQVLHASAEVLLTEVLPAVPADAAAPIISAGSNGHHTIYGDGQLFHGPHFQGIETLEACSETEMAALVKSAPAPKQWIQNPLRPGWLADPLALDSSFQMMILWSWEHREAGSLPCAIRSFRQYAAAFPKAGSRVVIQVTDASAPVVTADLHFLDRQGRLLAVAEGYECVMDQGLRGAFRQNCLPHGA
jgi:NAD(P)-dependent dehydrogenase (short-subunit alcohol dehydrogenase family)